MEKPLASSSVSTKAKVLDQEKTQDTYGANNIARSKNYETSKIFWILNSGLEIHMMLTPSRQTTGNQNKN